MKTALVVVAMAAMAAAAAVRGRGRGRARGNTEPTQIHLAQGDTVGSYMAASWISPIGSENSIVLYGTDPEHLDHHVMGEDPAQSYHFVSKYTGPYTSGLIHHVKFGPLEPSTKYYYQVGEEPGSTSAQFSFSTPPLPGPEVPYVFGVIGDLGQTVNSTVTREGILDDTTIGMTLLAGDLSYADSAWDPVALQRNCTQKRWDSWGEFIQPLAANQALMVLPGNHEVEQDGAPPATQEQFLAYQKRFRMPSKESGAHDGNLYYSFNVASAHIVMLNSYMPFNSTSDQFKWLQADLKNMDRSITPWLFVLMHAPWYNSNTHHHDEPEEVNMRADLEEMLFQYKADVIFAGHVHAYERTAPVYRNQTRPGAPTYINIGDAGNREGPADGYFTQPSWSVYREAKFGHGRLEVFNSTHAHWEWHRAGTPSQPIGDSVWVVKNSFLHKDSAAAGVSAFPGKRPSSK